MFSLPQEQHAWLGQFIGQWNFEHDCVMPDGSHNKSGGSMQCRSLGGLWLICESQSGEGENAWTSIMTLGFDPTKNKYLGTFVGSMMSHLWPYEGELDASGKRLPLNSNGPKFDGSGHCNYRDTLEIIDTDTWLMISETQGEDGSWHQFMTGRHMRA